MVHADDYDSFITQKNQKADLQKAKEIGIEAYSAEQEEKTILLEALLSGYNSGREKTLYCLAVNLLTVQDIQTVLEEAAHLPDSLPMKEKAAEVSARLREIAREKDLELKLVKKSK